MRGDDEAAERPGGPPLVHASRAGFPDRLLESAGGGEWERVLKPCAMLVEEVAVPLDAPTPLYVGERLRDLILCYAGPWAFVPYMRNREDSELLWHARQGVILAFAECVVTLAMIILGLFPVFGAVAVRFFLPLWLLWCLGMSVTSVLQASKGKRHRIPVIHQFVDYI